MAKKKPIKQQKAVALKTTPPILSVCLGALVYFVLISLGTPASVKVTTVVLMMLTLVVGLCFFKELRSQIYLPFLVMLGWVLSNALSTSYATSGKFALSEILKILLAFSLAILLMLFDRGEGEDTGRRMAGIMAIAVGIASLVSIDMFSTHIIATPIIKVLDLFAQGTYSHVNPLGADRINSIFSNANVYAGVSGIGVFLSLGLASTEPTEKKWNRRIYLSALYVNSLAFVLLLSRSAMLFIAVAFILHLFLENKDRRAPLLVLMIETLVLTAISTAVIAAVSFGKPAEGFHPIPLLCTVVGAVLLCVCEHFFHEKSLRIPHKVAVLVVCVVLVVAVVFCGIALLWTGPVDIEANKEFTRTIYPEPGQYTLTVDASAPVNVTIQGQSEVDIMLGDYPVLYEGEANGAAFTVPEDCSVVYFRFRSESDVTIHTANYTGTSTGSIPLDHKLLPEIVSVRLQGVLAHSSVIYRLTYFEDGMKLFRESPIIGLGLGSFENGLKSVQTFLYETKFVHNHYVQSLLDTGVIGLVLFVGTILSSLWALFRVLRKHPLAPALIACIIFMAAQASMDLVFSSYPYLPLAFGVFVLANMMGGELLPQPGKAVRIGAAAVAAAILATFFLLTFNNLYARRMVDSQGTFDASVQAASMDSFEWADYALSFVMSSLQYPDDMTLRPQADEFALKLEGIKSNSAHLKVAEYYLRTERPDKGMAELERHVTTVASDPAAWQATFNLLMAHDDGTDTYRAGVAHLGQMMLDWNSRNVGTITLDENATAYLEKAMN